MAALTIKISRDLDADVTVLRPAGRLNLATARDLRSNLLKCLTECPSAIVVDLGDCAIESPAALSVIPAVAQSHAAQPSVAMLLCGMGGPTDSAPAVLGALPVHASLADALAAAEDARRGQQRVHLHIARSPSGAGEAREAIGNACDLWGLSDLRHRATLIVSELVTNAIRHAGTDVEVDAALRALYLHLRVMDSDPTPPVMVAPADASTLAENGRGLSVVAHYSTGWGYSVDSLGAGKVVWATLRIRPAASAPSTLD